MLSTVVRLAIAGWILVALARAARAGWHQRRLVVAVWRAWRPRHLLGVAALFVLVAGVAGLLVGVVPGMDLGLGTLVGTGSNAVFAPLEEAVAATPAPASGPDWALALLATGFLVPLGLLLPWLAFVEEEVFRGGLESDGLARQLWRALVFGLAHLVMLVPVGAALAVGVAGFVYGRLYRNAHARGEQPPEPARRAYRPGRAGRRSLARQPARETTQPAPPAGGVAIELDTGPSPRDRQAAAVFHATVWHSAFNTAIVVIVWVSLLLGAFAV